MKRITYESAELVLKLDSPWDIYQDINTGKWVGVNIATGDEKGLNPESIEYDKREDLIEALYEKWIKEPFQLFHSN